ncbi:Fur-regulated basic protein FbpA [Aquibacillus koreensis]|uniref:Fur-regulated basic protein FbpA n=1 Tax=Aquibacillus koreensis TaxID=279446 RepID=A0A9X3WPX2_9BACI|nr:Fur-regulated basic protein FbpA [Aquibacillus koreensis]MCT2537762.1 Fur-regulated basic protein FbpA [Aquibacillus koreensis]MDC3421204.1 Fur-regulated basic protein FbpA [Aquibacillus koreensis]
MAYLKKAVDKQKAVLIHQLIQAGVVKEDDMDIYHKTISEIMEEYRYVTNKQTPSVPRRV